MAEFVGICLQQRNECRHYYLEVGCCCNKYLKMCIGFGTQQLAEEPERATQVFPKRLLMVEVWALGMLLVRAHKKWEICFWGLAENLTIGEFIAP